MTEGICSNLYKLMLAPIRKVHDFRFRQGLRVDGFSIISSNCLGGVLYHMLGMRMLSPTVNMFIKGESFVKIVNNPSLYLKELEPFSIEDNHVDGDEVYPLVGVGDVVLNCLHYKDCKEAIDAWNRRRDRVNLEKILVIATSWDLENSNEYIGSILESPFPKILFSIKRLDNVESVFYDSRYWPDKSSMPSLTDYCKHGWIRYFEKYFDAVSWINHSVK